MSDTIIKMTGGVIRQQKNTILKDVNVDIKSGEFIYLIGKVGSGKSSFLKTLYAELPLEYGTAEVAGFELKRIKKSQIPLLRRKCGIVFQDFKLLIDRDVYANLEFVLRATGWKNKKAIRERIETVLDKVGMNDKKHQMPHQLSGGEQQRIVLARALLNAPPIILADEPTGNIDPETSYRLVELLREICDTGKTIVIATHQYDLIEKYPGRVLCCSDGRLYEKCDPAIKQAIAEETATEQTIPAETAEAASTEESAACLLASRPDTINEKITVEETTVIPEAGIVETTAETVVVEKNIESAGESVKTEMTTITAEEILVEEKPIEETVMSEIPSDETPAGSPKVTGSADEIPALIEISPDEDISPIDSTSGNSTREKSTSEATSSEEVSSVKPALEDLISGDPHWEESAESFLGKLSFPEVTAFDYELSEIPVPAANIYQIPTEPEEVYAPATPIQVQTTAKPEKIKEETRMPEAKTPESEDLSTSSFPEIQPDSTKTEETKPSTPTFDLELID